MNFLKEKKILMLWAFLPLVFTLDLCYDPTGNECAGIPFKTDFAVNNSDDLSYWLLFIYDNTAPNFVYIMNTDEDNEVDIWLSDYGIHDLEVIFYGYTQSFDINQIRMNYMTIHVDNNFTFVSMLTFIELDIRFDININQGKARNSGKIDDISEFNSSRKYSRERLEFLDEDMNHEFDKDKTLISWSGYYLEIEYCFLKRNNFSSFSIILQFEKLKIPETFFGLIENISGNSISVIQLYIEDTPLKNITIELIASWNRIPTLSIEWGYTNAIIHHTISQTGNVVILLSNISITVTSGVQNATVNYKIYNDVSLIIHESIFPDCIGPNTVFLFNFAGIFNGSIVIPEECSLKIRSIDLLGGKLIIYGNALFETINVDLDSTILLNNHLYVSKKLRINGNCQIYSDLNSPKATIENLICESGLFSFSSDKSNNFECFVVHLIAGKGGYSEITFPVTVIRSIQLGVTLLNLSHIILYTKFTSIEKYFSSKEDYYMRNDYIVIGNLTSVTNNIPVNFRYDQSMTDFEYYYLLYYSENIYTTQKLFCLTNYYQNPKNLLNNPPNSLFKQFSNSYRNALLNPVSLKPLNVQNRYSKKILIQSKITNKTIFQENNINLNDRFTANLVSSLDDYNVYFTNSVQDIYLNDYIEDPVIFNITSNFTDTHEYKCYNFSISNYPKRSEVSVCNYTYDDYLCTSDSLKVIFYDPEYYWKLYIADKTKKLQLFYDSFYRSLYADFTDVDFNVEDLSIGSNNQIDIRLIFKEQQYLSIKRLSLVNTFIIIIDNSTNSNNGERDDGQKSFFEIMETNIVDLKLIQSSIISLNFSHLNSLSVELRVLHQYKNYFNITDQIKINSADHFDIIELYQNSWLFLNTKTNETFNLTEPFHDLPSSKSIEMEYDVIPQNFTIRLKDNHTAKILFKANSSDIFYVDGQFTSPIFEIDDDHHQLHIATNSLYIPVKFCLLPNEVLESQKKYLLTISKLDQPNEANETNPKQGLPDNGIFDDNFTSSLNLRKSKNPKKEKYDDFDFVINSRLDIKKNANFSIRITDNTSRIFMNSTIFMKGGSFRTEQVQQVLVNKLEVFQERLDMTAIYNCFIGSKIKMNLGSVLRVSNSKYKDTTIEYYIDSVDFTSRVISNSVNLPKVLKIYHESTTTFDVNKKYWLEEDSPIFCLDEDSVISDENHDFDFNITDFNCTSDNITGCENNTIDMDPENSTYHEGTNISLDLNSIEIIIETPTFLYGSDTYTISVFNGNYRGRKCILMRRAIVKPLSNEEIIVIVVCSFIGILFICGLAYKCFF